MANIYVQQLALSFSRLFTKFYVQLSENINIEKCAPGLAVRLVNHQNGAPLFALISFRLLPQTSRA
jgi:hypothetical protein